MTTSLANYTWEITHGDVTDRAYDSMVWYRFHELGLYEIRLTVTDSWGNTGVNFTALISVDDRDDDGLPDWWEMAYMDSVSPGATPTTTRTGTRTCTSGTPGRSRTWRTPRPPAPTSSGSTGRTSSSPPLP